ncbi:OmpA family protein [Bacteroidota bacterium]
MDFKRVFKFIIVFLFLISYHSNAKDGEGSIINAFGGFAGFNYNMHTADFNKLPEIPNCCPGFESGSGTGYMVGLFVQKDITHRFSLQVRAGYSILDGDLSNDEKGIPILDTLGNEVSGEFKHFMNTKLAIINLSPIVSYRIFKGLKLNIGINAGYLMTHNYEQYEEIVNPSDWGTFMDKNGEDSGERRRLDSSGEFGGVSAIQAFVFGGVSYELPLNAKKNMFIVPEIAFNYSITSILQDNPWNVNTINAGLSFVYYLRPPPPEKILLPDKVDVNLFAHENIFEVIGNPNDIVYGAFDMSDIERKAINAGIGISIRAVGVTDDEEDEDINLQVEEFLSTNMRPLLNYIFFDENSNELPKRYVRLSSSGINDFNEDSLINVETLPTYYQILNIIGQRMRKITDAKIKLTGCNSNSGSEKGNKILSKQRAEKISDYLTSVWDIDKKRIQIVNRNLPENPSSINDPKGVEENRRVEISSEIWELIKPVITSDTLLKASPQVIRFYPDVISKNNISKWELMISQPGESSIINNGEGKIPDKIDWVINKNKSLLHLLTDPLEYEFDVIDAKGNNVASDLNKIPLAKITIRKKQREKLGDKRIDRYSLILFKFNSSELSSGNIKIADFIKNRIEINSEVKITGYTDDMGDDDYNRKLSEERAKNLKDNLSLRKAFIRGLGESEKIYDNSLPEGRFYSRTVEVVVETPVKW